MKKNFKVGDKVMANFGRYGSTNWKVDTIIAETKTLWKCNNFSFSKAYNTVRSGNDYRFTYVWHYNGKQIESDLMKEKVWKDWKVAMNKLSTINTNTDFETMQKFIDWTNENIKDNK